MFGYGIYVGYVATSSIRYLESGAVTFLLSTRKDNKFSFPCMIKEQVTKEWFSRHFDRTSDVFRGCTVVCKGELFVNTYNYMGHKNKTVVMNVEFIEFLDFKNEGRNTLANPKFYDRHLLDWERYFNEKKEDI